MTTGVVLHEIKKVSRNYSFGVKTYATLSRVIRGTHKCDGRRTYGICAGVLRNYELEVTYRTAAGQNAPFYFFYKFFTYFPHGVDGRSRQKWMSRLKKKLFSTTQNKSRRESVYILLSLKNV